MIKRDFMTDGDIYNNLAKERIIAIERELSLRYS